MSTFDVAQWLAQMISPFISKMLQKHQVFQITLEPINILSMKHENVKVIDVSLPDMFPGRKHCGDGNM